MLIEPNSLVHPAILPALYVSTVDSRVDPWSSITEFKNGLEVGVETSSSFSVKVNKLPLRWPRVIQYLSYTYTGSASIPEVSILARYRIVLVSIACIDTVSIRYRYSPLNLPHIQFSFLTIFLPRTTVLSKNILEMSSLLEPDSSFTQSVIAESTTSTDTLSHDKRKWRSPVWQYCRRPILDKDQTHLYCTRCLSDPTHEDYKEGPFHGNYVENIKKHLKRHHGIIIEKALSKNQMEVNY